MRGVQTLSRLVHVFGRLVYLDENTIANWDLRWARVKVAIPERGEIPPFVPVGVKNDEDGYALMKVVVAEEIGVLEPIL